MDLTELKAMNKDWENAKGEKPQPPKNMEELRECIAFSGAVWRKDHARIKATKDGGETVETPKPTPHDIAMGLMNYVTFTFIGKGENTDLSPLYIYHLDEGVYISSLDLFNTLCYQFDNRVDPKKWAQVNTIIRTMVKIRKPLESKRLLPVKNGIVDLETRELKPFSPRYVITSKIETAYKKPNNIPLDREGNSFDDWLSSIACNDDELVTLFWQVIAECINPNHTRGKIAILYGDGNNGKGTFQRMLINLIGISKVATLKPAEFKEKHTLESLVGKVCNIGDEVPDSYLKNVSNLMSIATGDTVSVNPKGTKVFEMTFKTFLLFSGNYLPSSGNRTKGWYRRLMIVPFNADFNGEKEKPWVKNEFLADKNVLEYILYKAINQEPFENFITPKAVTDLLEEYKEDNDYVYSYLKDEYIPKGWDKLKAVPLTLLKQEIKIYAINSGIDRPNVAHIGKAVINHLKEMTGESYTIKNARVNAEDSEILNPYKNGEDSTYYRGILSKTNKCIVTFKK